MIIIDAANYNLLNVHSVVVIPKTKTSTQDKKDKRKGNRKSNFSKIFDSALEKEVSDTIEYTASGYTKNAKSYTTHYETKEYL